MTKKIVKNKTAEPVITMCIPNPNIIEQMVIGKHIVAWEYDDFGYSFEDLVGDSFNGVEILEGAKSSDQWISKHIDLPGYLEEADGVATYYYDKNTNTKGFLKDMTNFFKRNGYLAFPLYKYEHSSVAYSIQPIPYGDCWDGGLDVAGFVILDKETVKELLGVKRLTNENAFDLASSFITTYQSWANGEVATLSCYTLDSKLEDSVGGFLMNQVYTLEMAAHDHFELNKKRSVYWLSII